MTTNDLNVIIGAGPLGQGIARTLLAQGARVRLVTRSGRAAGVAGAEQIAADVMRRDDAIAACAGAATVFQCAAPPYQSWPEMFPTLQENVLQGAARAGAVLAAAENLYGYGVAGDLHEGLPLTATTRKGKVRAAMSARLFDAHCKGELRTVAGRASDFFGPGVRTSSLGDRLWPDLLAGKPVNWFGDADVPHSFTYVPDFADALVRLAHQDSAWGRAWHVPSPPVQTPRQVMARIARLAGLAEPKIRRTPKLVLRGVGLFVPAAGELIELAYSYEAAFVLSDAAFVTKFGGQATGWDAALTATRDWWQNDARRARPA